MKKRLGRIIAAIGILAVLCLVLTACVAPIGRNQDPVANFTADQEDGTFKITFDGSNSFDPDPDGEVILWNWDFEEGETGSGVTVTHTYAASGKYPVRLLVRDDDGASDEITKDVTVKPDLMAGYPIASFRFCYCNDQPQTGSTICFNGKKSHDPDGWITWGYWNFGDGSPIAYGPWTEWEYDEYGMWRGFSVMREVTHTYTEVGRYAVILEIIDNEGKAATAFGTVIVR